MAVKKTTSSFPAPAAGQKRYVLHLDKRTNEKKLQVSILAKVKKHVDSAANYSINGSYTEKTVKNSNLKYYEVSAGKLVAKTKAVSTKAGTKTDQYVSYSRRKLISYSSKEPVVVYVPRGVVLKYQILSPTTAAKAVKGKSATVNGIVYSILDEGVVKTTS